MKPEEHISYRTSFLQCTFSEMLPDRTHWSSSESKSSLSLYMDYRRSSSPLSKTIEIPHFLKECATADYGSPIQCFMNA
ncbi:hypothetical protein IscW_ISCW004973, partial [Ixodes scapularis]